MGCQVSASCFGVVPVVHVPKLFMWFTWSYLGQGLLYLHPDVFWAISHIQKSSGYFLLEGTSNLAYSNQNSSCFPLKSAFLPQCALSVIGVISFGSPGDAPNEAITTLTSPFHLSNLTSAWCAAVTSASPGFQYFKFNFATDHLLAGDLATAIPLSYHKINIIKHFMFISYNNIIYTMSSNFNKV